MSIFRKKNPLSVPAPYTADDIKLGASACTGEKTIGFYDKTAKKLVYEELVRSEKDIADFYRKYGLEPPCGEMKELI